MKNRTLIASMATLGCALILSGATRADLPTQRYFVQLEMPAVGELRARQLARGARLPDRAAQRAHTTRVRAQQNQMSRQIAPIIERELGRLTIAVNGIKVRATANAAEQLRRTKGVRAVARIAQHDIDNAASVEWIGAPQIWESLGDASGITIAVIDSGVDYLHANFGGDGDADAYAANDKNVIEAGTFPTAKVIGGWDFAGPTYNSRVDDVPLPDPDPLDGNGHGSHVAGTAAGIGVTNRIGPGVAKGAKILALKVFSDDSGSTDLTADAIDYALDPNGDGAIDDRVDVINMSLGARYGDQNDPSALASTVAVQNGVIVVASAGNNGDNAYVTGSPGVSPHVITVGATIAGGRPQIAVRVIAKDQDLAGLYPAQQGSGDVRIVDAPVTAPLVVARSPAVDDDDLLIDGEFDERACRDLTNHLEVNGHIVLVARGGCSYEAKYANVQQAGGKAIIAYNDSESDAPFIMGGVGVSEKEITIPGLMISGTDAQRLKNALGTTPFVIDLAPSNNVPGPPELDDRLTGFTSRGPATGGAQFKPDLSAPGRYTMSTFAGTGIRARQLRGTSMAAPHVAGAAALMRQQFPDLPVAAIKALLQNAAVDSEIDGPGTNTVAPLMRQGVGTVRVAQAIALQSYAAPAGVSFGYRNTAQDQASSQTVMLHNLAAQARVFSVTSRARDSLPGVTVSCPDNVAVAANGSTSFTIDLAITASELSADQGALSHTEADGWCVLSDGIDTLRVGYVAAVDPAANVRIALGATTATLSNDGISDGDASGFQLVATGGTREATRTIGAVGVRYAQFFGLDVMQLGIALNESWEAPAHVSVQMLIDAHGDGIYERALFGGDWSLLRFDPGTYVTGVYQVVDNDRPNFATGYTDWFTNDVDFNDQVMILPYSLIPSVGLSFLKPDERAFDYRLRVISRDGSYDEQFGRIDLDTVQVTEAAQGRVVSGGLIDVAVPADVPLLWLMPNNVDGNQWAIETPPNSLQSAH